MYTSAHLSLICGFFFSVVSNLLLIIVSIFVSEIEKDKMREKQRAKEPEVAEK